LKKLVIALAMTAVVLGTTPLTAQAVAPALPSQSRAAEPVRVRVPDSVIEGERFKAVVRLDRPAAAQLITLQRQDTDILGNKEWTELKSVRAKGQAKHVFKVFAEETSTGRFRATVTFRDDKPERSKPSRATVWRWTYLYAFDSYYATTGVWGDILDRFAMNGTQYNGWHTYGDQPSWEERFTVGRHCKAIRGDLGVTDDSEDGTSALIALAADDTSVFISGTLTPGMVQRAEVKLNLPYRLSIQAGRTSTDDLSVYPAIGSPELLCTGI
jgi:hypothetical protein